jgi:hypothetical protein
MDRIDTTYLTGFRSRLGPLRQALSMPCNLVEARAANFDRAHGAGRGAIVVAGRAGVRVSEAMRCVVGVQKIASGEVIVPGQPAGTPALSPPLHPVG